MGGHFCGTVDANIGQRLHQPRDHRGKLGVTCTDASSAVDFGLSALTPGIAARSARHPGDSRPVPGHSLAGPRPHPLLSLGKQGASIPAQEGRSSMKRVADLLVRGLSSSSFCFLEITWKTQGKETLEPSLVITDKHGENWARVSSPVFSLALLSPPPEPTSHLSYLD